MAVVGNSRAMSCPGRDRAFVARRGSARGPASGSRRGGKRRLRVRWGRVLGCVVVLLALLWAVVHSPWFMRYRYPLLYQNLIVAYSREAGVSPALTASVIRAESGYDAGSVSAVGAVGLMQLMPETASWVAELHGLPAEEGRDLARPEVSVRLGTLYLGWLSQRFGSDKAAALAAYNVGQHKVDEWLETTPGPLVVEDIPYAETRHFVRKVLAGESIYARLYPALSQEPRLVPENASGAGN